MAEHIVKFKLNNDLSSGEVIATIAKLFPTLVSIELVSNLPSIEDVFYGKARSINKLSGTPRKIALALKQGPLRGPQVAVLVNPSKLSSIKVFLSRMVNSGYCENSKQGYTLREPHLSQVLQWKDDISTEK